MGFWGVMVTTLLSAAVHIPSTLLNYGNNMQWIVVRFLETVHVGFVLGYACWRTGRLLMSVSIHGLINFTPSVFSTKTGLGYQRSAFNQPCFQLAGLTGQVGATACHCHIFFENSARQTGDR